ncbi:MAG: hypothetical protein WAQ05_08380 [Rubrivivax sp.]
MLMLRDDLPLVLLPPEHGRARMLLAMALHGVSLLLGQLAMRLLPAARAPAGEPVLEFYAQAGAPEGALYVDGELVGRLDGVSRL